MSHPHAGHAPHAVRASTHSMPEPDIAVLKWRDDYYAEQDRKPEDILLIIEASDTSLRKDRELKLPLNAEAGVPECWIVDVQRKAVEVFRKPSGDRYDERFELQAGKELELVALERIRVELADLVGA